MTFTVPILKAIGPAGSFHTAVEGEAAAKAGCNRTLTILSQLRQTAVFANFIALHTPVSLKVQILAAFCLTPMIGIADCLLDDDSPYKKPVRWLYDHFGELMQVAVCINALALFCLGFYTYGAVSCAFLTWGLLEKYHCLPLKVRSVYQAAIPWISQTALLIQGMPLLKLAAAIELSSLAYPKVTALWAYLFPKPKEVLAPLTYAHFEEIRKERTRFKVSRSHIEIEPFPQTRERDFNKILLAWDALDWEKQASSLKLEVENDPRWQQSEDFIRHNQAVAQERPRIQVAYARKQLEALVKNIQNKTIQTGQPLNYAPLENYLGVIAEQLPKLDPDSRRTLLLKLALQGGQYCGPGIFTQLMEAATASLGATSPLPFKEKVLLILQQERFDIVQAYHLRLEQMHIVLGKRVGGTGDVHAMNFMARLIAEDFHLPNTGASADEVAPLPFFEKWCYRKLLGINPESLWTTTTITLLFSRRNTETIEGYTPQRIFEAIQFSKNKMPLLTNDDFVTWAQRWIEKPTTGATMAEKAAFLDQLEAGAFHNGTEVKDCLIRAALVDMGILQIA